MNKLLGFYELKRMGLPSVRWETFEKGTQLDDTMLWTIRSAVVTGNDQSLPRLIGAPAEEAMHFAEQLLDQFGNRGMVVYYPFFIAQKSGNLDVSMNRVVIEAVEDDLWNLVDHSDRAVTILIDDHCIDYHGDSHFLSSEELEMLTRYISEIRQRFRSSMLEGRSAMLEWSFAFNSDRDKHPVGNKYLVFYEARTV